MEHDEDFENSPDLTDFHGSKRELIKRGMKRGHLTWEEIEAALPRANMSDTEFEVLLFTLKSLRISVPERP